MDLLDRVAGPASDLLERVDALLTTNGAPVDHPVWPMLRRVGALPGDAFAAIVTLAPEALRPGVESLATLAGDCRSAVVAAPAQIASQGLAADGYMARWPDLSRQIAGEGDGLDARVQATATYLDDVARWATSTRRAVAAEAGTCLGSAEAVAVREVAAGVADAGAVTAAADIAARVLAAVSRSIDEGWQVQQRWRAIRAEEPVRLATVAVSVPHHIEVR